MKRANRRICLENEFTRWPCIPPHPTATTASTLPCRGRNLHLLISDLKKNHLHTVSISLSVVYTAAGLCGRAQVIHPHCAVIYIHGTVLLMGFLSA